MERYVKTEGMLKDKRRAEAIVAALMGGRGYHAEVFDLGFMGSGIWVYGPVRPQGRVYFLWGTALGNWGADVYPSMAAFHEGVGIGSVETQVSSDETALDIVVHAMHEAMVAYKRGGFAHGR